MRGHIALAKIGRIWGAVANRLASTGYRNRGIAGHGVGYRDGGT